MALEVDVLGVFVGGNDTRRKREGEKSMGHWAWRKEWGEVVLEDMGSRPSTQTQTRETSEKNAPRTRAHRKTFSLALAFFILHLLLPLASTLGMTLGS